MVAAVEGAGVSVLVVSYRRPLFASKVDVVGQGAVQREVALYGFVPCQQAVGVVDLVGIAVLRHGVSRVFCRGKGDGVGIFLARFPFGCLLHLIDEDLAVGEGAGDEGRARCHTLRGYERSVGVTALVIRGDYGRVAVLGGEAGQLDGPHPLGVVRQDDGHPRRAVGEAERGVAVAHRLFLGYDEVAGLEVLPGTLVGFYHHGKRGCLALGVGPPGGDEAVGVVGPVVRVGGGQRGAGVVGGGGRHVVRFHRAVHQDCHALHALPVPVHGGTGTGGGCRRGVQSRGGEDDGCAFRSFRQEARFVPRTGGKGEQQGEGYGYMDGCSFHDACCLGVVIVSFAVRAGRPCQVSIDSRCR